MAEGKLRELQLDVEELKSLKDKTTRSKVKDLLSVQIRKLETDIVDLREKIQAEESVSKTTSSTGEKKVVEVQLKDYSWDQSDKYVKVYLTGLAGLDKCPKDNVNVSMTNDSVSVRLGPMSDTNNKVFIFSIRKTSYNINPDKSYSKVSFSVMPTFYEILPNVQVKPDYLLLFLAKETPGTSWSHITFAEKAAADAKKKSDDLKFDDKADPSAGLMNVNVFNVERRNNFYIQTIF